MDRGAFAASSRIDSGFWRGRRDELGRPMRTGRKLIELLSKSRNIADVVCGRRGQRIGENDPKRGQADEHDQQLPAHVVHSMPWLARYCATFFRRDHQ